jgi:sugar lactone lactonase YvrE
LSAVAATSCGGSSVPPTYRLERLVGPGSAFHGVHGLRFDSDDNLYATSVIGQSIFRVDTATGAVERIVGPPEGMADDLAFAADGTMVWTAIEDGIVYAKAPNGPIRRLLENRRGVNAVSFSPDGRRLFVSLVFYGDALYELDLAGGAPPRLIAEGMGGLNAFQVADDGLIYGPLLFAGRVVRIDPATGAISTVSADFERPGALKLDFRGSAYVLDGNQLKRVELASGATTATVSLPYEADNLALDSEGRLFVSMAEPNAIAEVAVDTGQVRYVVPPSILNSPTGVAVSSEGGSDTIYVGDLFGGVRRVDGDTGTLETTPRLELFQPAHVAVAGEHLLAVSQVFGTVQRLDRASFAVLATWEGFNKPGDAVETANGDVIVAETGAGRVVRVTGPEPMDRLVMAANLSSPTGLAMAGTGLYVTESVGGRVLRIGLETGSLSVLAEGLDQPEGIAVAPDGGIVVMEVAARQLTRIDPAGASVTVMARDLPVGLSNGPSLYRGVAASPTAVYFSSDVDNAVYRLARAQP